MSESSDITDIQQMRRTSIGRLFLRAHRAYSAWANVKMRERGYEEVSLAHTALLVNLDIKGTRLTALAERAGMTKQSMGQLATDLENKGYIQRVDDPSDKRAILVKFTEKGMQFLRDGYDVKREIEAEFATILGEGGMSQLYELLNSLLNEIDRSKGIEESDTEDEVPLG
jgi:DNA-binding MarR family transcriptional regulator